MTVRQIRQLAQRMLADYDDHRANEIFAERGTDWLTVDDAYAVQRAVADLRRARGETLPRVQSRLHQSRDPETTWSQPVCTGIHLAGRSSGFRHSFTPRFLRQESGQPLCERRYRTVRLSLDLATPIANHDDLHAFVDCWFPVIEPHNNVFRGLTRTSQELIAGNAMHAGFVAPLCGESLSVLVLAESRIRVEIDGSLMEMSRIAELTGGPLGSLRWLASSLAATTERVKAGDIVLTGFARAVKSGGRILLGRSDM